MENEKLRQFLNTDLNEKKNCECCPAPVSTHLIFIRPTKKGGCCGVFHLCTLCADNKFNFGDEKFSYELFIKTKPHQV